MSQGELYSGGSARAWVCISEFGLGGIRFQGEGPCLTVCSINPERGTDGSIQGRLDLVQMILLEFPKGCGETLFLATAGFFGCHSAPGKNGRGLHWSGISVSDKDRVKTTINNICKSLPPSVHLLVGIDYNGEARNQHLWYFQGKSPESFMDQNRILKSNPIKIGPFYVLPFVCGSIFGDGGIAIDCKKDLKGIDVIVDAAHVSLNSQRDRYKDASLLFPRWAFHRVLRMIGDEGRGAVFSHSHDGDLLLLRNRNDWVVFAFELPFPEHICTKFVISKTSI